MDKDEQKPKEEKPNNDIKPPKFIDKKGGYDKTKDDECEDEDHDEQLNHLFDEE